MHPPPKMLPSEASTRPTLETTMVRGFGVVVSPELTSATLQPPDARPRAMSGSVSTPLGGADDSLTSADAELDFDALWNWSGTNGAVIGAPVMAAAGPGAGGAGADVLSGFGIAGPGAGGGPGSTGNVDGGATVMAGAFLAGNVPLYPTSGFG